MQPIWATSDCVPRSEALGTPRQQGLCSQFTHLWASADFLPALKHRGPPDGRGYVANPPICGPFLILSPCSEALGTPPDGRGYVANLPICTEYLVLFGLSVPLLRSLWGAVRNRQLYILRMYSKNCIFPQFSFFFFKELHVLLRKKLHDFTAKKNGTI